MHYGHIIETILTILIMIFIVMVMLGMLLVVEVVNFVVGQPVAFGLKLGAFSYLGAIFAGMSYLAARKIYHAIHYS